MKGMNALPELFLSLTAWDPTTLQLERLWSFLCLCPWTPLSPSHTLFFLSLYPFSKKNKGSKGVSEPQMLGTCHARVSCKVRNPEQLGPAHGVACGDAETEASGKPGCPVGLWLAGSPLKLTGMSLGGFQKSCLSGFSAFIAHCGFSFIQ